MTLMFSFIWIFEIDYKSAAAATPHHHFHFPPTRPPTVLTRARGQAGEKGDSMFFLVKGACEVPISLPFTLPYGGAARRPPGVKRMGLRARPSHTIGPHPA